VVEAESLVPICKLYEDVTPLFYQISINDLKWFPIPKEQTSPPSYGKKLFLDAAGLLSPDQLWIIERTGLWWSRSQC